MHPQRPAAQMGTEWADPSTRPSPPVAVGGLSIYECVSAANDRWINVPSGSAMDPWCLRHGDGQTQTSD